MIDLNKIDSTKFVLIVLVLAFFFCILISNQMKAINNRIIDLLEYQTKLLGEDYKPEIKTTTTYPSTTIDDKYKY